MDRVYDIVFLGNYTRDTIVSPRGTRVVDGGAFFYGASVAARMGLKTAAVTRLAREDFRVVEELKGIGVDVFARVSPRSTCLRLEYPSSNVDERVIYVTSTAGAFLPEEVKDIQAKAFLIGGSFRGEAGLDLLVELVKKEARISVDMQGFVRVAKEGKLVYEQWPEKEQVLARADVLKTDAVEAEMLTGKSDIREAARLLYESGPREIVLTHRNGLLVYTGDEFFEAGFYPRELIGRSGRGDTCIASYMAGRISLPPAKAAVWAAAVTSLKLEAEGPFRREIGEVEELIQKKY